MKIAIIGSRTFNDYDLFKNELASYDITYIVSGGAVGADKLAEHYAKEFGIPIFIYYPDWDRYGKKAGFMRNQLIVNAADYVIAFWDGISRGTASSIDYAKKIGKPFNIIDIVNGGN